MNRRSYVDSRRHLALIRAWIAVFARLAGLAYLFAVLLDRIL